MAAGKVHPPLKGGMSRSDRGEDWCFRLEAVEAQVQGIIHHPIRQLRWLSHLGKAFSLAAFARLYLFPALFQTRQRATEGFIILLWLFIDCAAFQIKFCFYMVPYSASSWKFPSAFSEMAPGGTCRSFHFLCPYSTKKEFYFIRIWLCFHG